MGEFSSDRVIAVDVDHTVLVSDGPPSYANPRAIDGARESLNKLQESGWVIDFFTARHHNLYDHTFQSLVDLGFKFRRLVMGKVPARFYIDDRAVGFTSWSETLSKVEGAA